jgi:hypothetical protein
LARPCDACICPTAGPFGAATAVSPGRWAPKASSVNASPLSAVENKAESGGKESRVLVGSMVQAYRHRCPILNAPHSSTRCSFNSGLPMTSAID